MGRNGHNPRAVGIVRVSKVGGRRNAVGERFRSPEDQDARVRALAHDYGARLDAVYEDLDVSGAVIDRPGLNAAMAAIRNGEAEVLVAARLDRVARDVRGGLAVLDEVEAHGGAIIVGDFDIDTRRPEGRKVFTDFLAMAEVERRLKGASLRAAAEGATREGIAIAPLLPGYRKTADRRVELDPDRAPLIRPMFERRASGASWTAIREWWHGETGEWVKLSRFRKMVESRLYRGELTYGAVTSPVRHAELVDERLWKDAQTVPAARPPRSNDSPALATGILTCSGCGRPMTLSRGGGGSARLYRCQSRNKPGWTCPAPVTLMQERADAWLEEQFLAWAGSAAELVTTADLEEDFAAADARVADAEEELAAYLEATSARDSRFAAGADKRREAVDEAVAARKALEDERVVAGVRYRVADEWPSLDVEEKRLLLRAGIAAAVVHPALATDAGGRKRLPVGDRVALTFATDG